MRTFLFLAITLFFFSCGNKNRLPKDVLSKEKMESVLWDIMRADELASYEHEKDSTVNRFQRSVELYRQVFQIHKTNEAQFRKSFQYYESHPLLLKPVFDSLQQRRRSTYPLSRPVD